MSIRLASMILSIGLLGLASAVADDAKPIRIAGKLTKITGKALTVGGAVVTCNDATKVSRDGKGAASFSDLQVGQQVRAYRCCWSPAP